MLLACLLALVACGPSSALLEFRTLDSEELARPMAYALLPAPGAGDAEVRHVFYVLHGLGDDPRDPVRDPVQTR